MGVVLGVSSHIPTLFAILTPWSDRDGWNVLVRGKLSCGMRQLNGRYPQRINRRHGLVGHVLQGQSKALLVQKEPSLLDLAF